MTVLWDGNLTLLKAKIKSNLARDTLFIQKLMASHALTTIEAKVRVLDHKNTLWLNSDALNCQLAWRNSSLADQFSWLLPLSDQKPCTDKLTATCSLKVNTEFSKWKTMNCTFAVKDLLETWHFKSWQKKQESTHACIKFKVKNSLVFPWKLPSLTSRKCTLSQCWPSACKKEQVLWLVFHQMLQMTGLHSEIFKLSTVLEKNIMYKKNGSKISTLYQLLKFLILETLLLLNLLMIWRFNLKRIRKNSLKPKIRFT